MQTPPRHKPFDEHEFWHACATAWSRAKKLKTNTGNRIRRKLPMHNLDGIEGREKGGDREDFERGLSKLRRTSIRVGI